MFIMLAQKDPTVWGCQCKLVTWRNWVQPLPGKIHCCTLYTECAHTFGTTFQLTKAMRLIGFSPSQTAFHLQPAHPPSSLVYLKMQAVTLNTSQTT